MFRENIKHFLISCCFGIIVFWVLREQFRICKPASMHNVKSTIDFANIIGNEKYIIEKDNTKIGFSNILGNEKYIIEKDNTKIVFPNIIGDEKYIIEKDNTKITLQYHYTGQTDMCKSAKPGTIHFIAFVFSSVHNIDQRQRLRKGFEKELKELSGKRKQYVFKYQFIIGKSIIPNETLDVQIQKEHEKYGDIIQGDFIDSYDNLAMKHFHAFNWLKVYCKEESQLKQNYFLKIDDDVEFFVDFLFENFVSLVPKTKHWIMGNAQLRSTPVRDPAHKFFVSKSLYPKDLYPDFTSGFTFIMPMYTVPVLYESVLETHPLYLDDVYITGLARAHAKIIDVITGPMCAAEKRINIKNCMACHECFE